jgi:tRNA threonylcarbamoyladenosine biosynthesis protein TsaE
MPEIVKPVSEQVFQLADLPRVAAALFEAGNDLPVWLLFGEMGSGKTTLVKEIIRQMGIRVTVASPTFSIVNEYGAADRIVYHFDLYRLKNEAEAFDIGLEEYLASGHRCLVEWPEKIRSLWPHPYFEIELKHHLSQSRKIFYRRHD